MAYKVMHPILSESVPVPASLTVTSISEDDFGSIVVQVEMPFPTVVTNDQGHVLGHTTPWVQTPHTIYIPKAAFDDRVREYGLTNRYEAFRAIMKEHVKRVGMIPDGMNTQSARHNALGGLLPDTTINVVIPSSVRPQLQAILSSL